MIRIAFFGDFLYPFDKDIVVRIEDEEIFDKIDLCIGNLESPIISNVKQYKKFSKIINLYSFHEIEYFMNRLKIKVVSLANNHIFDYGVEGFRDTLLFLDKLGIKYCGAGMNLDKARIPCIINIKGIRLGILSYGWSLIQCFTATSNRYGVAPLKRDIIGSDILNLKNKVDYVIIMIHWGYELEIYPLPIHRNLARELIEMGANIVIGSHPHVIQGFEKWKNGYIFYSLGNFFFPNFSFGKIYVNFQKKFIREGLPYCGFFIVFSISLNKVEEFNLYQVSTTKNNNYILQIKSLDREMKDWVYKLNYPLNKENNEYIKFFIKNRKIKKGLPVFKGDKGDIIKIFIFKIREKIIELLIKLLNFLRGGLS